MISLQLAISNLKTNNYQIAPPQQIHIKFGSIHSTLSIASGQGGKCLHLSLTKQELQDTYSRYACGLFIQNTQGNYFCLLSLQKVALDYKLIGQPISFMNDLRQVKYTGQFTIVANVFKSPKVADTTQIQNRQAALQSMKKPALPARTHQNNLAEVRQNNKEINSFLYGNQKQQKAKSPKSKPPTDNLKTMKQDIRKQNQKTKLLQKAKNNIKLPPQALSKQPQSYINDDDLFDCNPPAMQFINEEQPEQQQLQVPQIEYVQYGESIDKRSKQKNNYQTPGYNFATFNRRESQQNRRDSPETPTEFQLDKKSSQVISQKGLTKQEIKNMAKKQAQSRVLKDTVMIPIIKNGGYQLVPLSSLKPEQIIDYVQKQRKNQEEAQQNKQRKIKLQLKQQEVIEKNRKLMQMMERREKQREIVPVKRPSKEIRESVHNEIKEQNSSDSQAVHHEQQQDDDYASDFESVSASNSIIKSRISNNGKLKNSSKQQKQDESGLQDEYSQQFDSYSHSMLSKTNRPKQKQKSDSISDYSESYRSISNSFRK